MFYFIALARAHKRVVEQLREQLVLVRSDPTLYWHNKENFRGTEMRHAEEYWFSESPGYVVFGTGSEECFRNYPGKITKALWYLSVKLISWVTAATATKSGYIRQHTCKRYALRSCVPVFHLLPCLSPLICMVFSAKQEPESCVSCPFHHLAQPPLLFRSLPSERGAQLPTLPSRPLFLQCLFWSCSWVQAQHSWSRYWKWEKSPLTSPVEKGASAEMLLCGHQKPLPGLAAFVVLWSDKLLESELSLPSGTSHFLMK